MGSLAMFRTGEEKETKIGGVHRYLYLSEGHTPCGGEGDRDYDGFFLLSGNPILNRTLNFPNISVERDEFPVWVLQSLLDMACEKIF